MSFVVERFENQLIPAIHKLTMAKDKHTMSEVFGDIY
jgi:hypothetical protein